jgi:hypothetical protein
MSRPPVFLSAFSSNFRIFRLGKRRKKRVRNSDKKGSGMSQNTGMRTRKKNGYRGVPKGLHPIIYGINNEPFLEFSELVEFFKIVLKGNWKILFNFISITACANLIFAQSFLKEKILLDAMFEVPESDIISVRIDEDVITGKKPIEYVRSKRADTPADKSADDSGDESSTDKSANDADGGERKSKAQTYA